MSGAATPFVPPPGPSWERIDPRAAGFDPDRLDAAIAFHQAHESAWPRSMYYPDGRYVATVYVQEAAAESDIVGPARARGGVNGLILRGGRLVAEWGDTGRADMTFSIAKSYLAVLAGLAHHDGLIPDLDRPVAFDVPGEWFSVPHNAGITWRHLLQQTSEWQGTLWGKPDTIDHNRTVGRAVDNARKGVARRLARSGTHFEYNDVRVNLLAACLLRRFRRPLPEVLKERIMDPIGASSSWEWHGYSTSWTEIDGQRMQSVSGGGHWGGGLFISSRDHARLGLLVARRGQWGDRTVISPEWVAAMTSPSPLNDEYGFLWWLAGGSSSRYPSAPRDSVFALGGGANMIWIAPGIDLVSVVRWIDRECTDAFIARVMEALT